MRRPFSDNKDLHISEIIYSIQRILFQNKNSFGPLLEETPCVSILASDHLIFAFWVVACRRFDCSCYGEQGWRSGESTRLPPMWPRLKSRRRHHMWVEFFVGSLLCCERFFSGYSGFPLSSKTNISKFHFDRESGRLRTTMWVYYLQIVIYLFILFIYGVIHLFSDLFSYRLGQLTSISLI